MHLVFQWSWSQQLALTIITTTSSILSVVGCLFIIFGKRVQADKPGSVNDFMVYVLALINLPLAVCFGLGPVPFDVLHSHTLCTTQGFLIQVLGLMSVVWTCCLAHSLFAWIVLKRNMQTLSDHKKWYFFVTIALPLTISVMLLRGDNFGPAGSWCWINDTRFQIPCFWLEVACGWLFNMVVFVAIHRETAKRLAKKTRFTTTTEQTANNSARTIQRRLSLFMLVFIFEWFFGLLNRFVNLVHGVSFFLTVLHCLFVPLQGWLNAIVYSSLHSNAVSRFFSPNSRVAKLLPSSFPRSNDDNNNNENSKNEFPLGTLSPRMGNLQNHPSLSSLKLHVITWNMGEAKVPKNISDILPQNHKACDIIAIGVQECLHLSATKEALSRSIGPEYSMHAAEIGNSNTFLGFHGYIALMCFVRTSFLEDGVVELVEMASDSGLKRGVNLGVSRASNKGAIALSFRMFGSQVTFLTAHLAADKGGGKTSGLEKRNEDVQAILREFVVDYDDIGFDMQLCRHHTIFLGDLNYRLEASAPTEILELISKAYSSHTTIHSKNNNNKTNNNKEITPVQAEARDKLRELDQLCSARSAGTVFYDWYEMPISFPPTYRLVKNATHSSYGSVASLQQFYSTKRMPSYTDRILVYSQEDVKPLLVPEEYNSNARVICSDHTPVFASFSLARDSNTAFFAQESFAATVWQHVTIELSEITVDFCAEIENQNIHAVKIVFPLPHEDPFFEQRKIHALESALSTNDADPTSSENSNHHTTEQITVITENNLTTQKISATATTPVLLSSVHFLLEIQPIGIQCVFAVECGGEEKNRTKRVRAPLVKGGRFVATVNAVLDVTVA